MRLRWTPAASGDLDHIFDWIREDRPRVAEEVIQRILAGLSQLEKHPRLGRRGSRPGTRELIFPGLPYLAVYRVRNDQVQILRLIHGAQDWP